MLQVEDITYVRKNEWGDLELKLSRCLVGEPRSKALQVDFSWIQENCCGGSLSLLLPHFDVLVWGSSFKKSWKTFCGVETKLWNLHLLQANLEGWTQTFFCPSQQQIPTKRYLNYKSWEVEEHLTKRNFLARRNTEQRKKTRKMIFALERSQHFSYCVRWIAFFPSFAESVKVFIGSHLYQWYFGICQKIWGIFELLGIFGA